MPKLILLKGLPASGKSTKAKEIVEQGGWVRVNRDLLRTMLHFDNFTSRNEGRTVDAEKALVRSFLTSNMNVVVDDCNLNPKNRDMWSGIARDCNSKFEVEDMKTHWSECVSRDSSRDKRVGKDVIKDMALQYNLFKSEKGIVLCDIDGTIADVTHRLHHVKKEPKDWKSFFEALEGDAPRTDVLFRLWELEDQGYDVMFVTARPEDYRSETETWLQLVAKVGWRHFTMVMRRSGDKRPDTEVKQEMYDKYFKHYNVVKVFDDRPRVIEMWRENGLEVEDVGAGIDF